MQTSGRQVTDLLTVRAAAQVVRLGRMRRIEPDRILVRFGQRSGYLALNVRVLVHQDAPAASRCYN